eukprot:gene3585-5562_t
MARPWEKHAKFTLEAPKTCLIQGGRRKVHASYHGGIECVEEYDVITDKLLVRKWRMESRLGGEGRWDHEVGTEGLAPSSDFLVESTANPLVTRIDTDKLFEWRIRNLPYPKETYEVSVDRFEIVVRTTNKKYFKRLLVGDMARRGMALESDALTWNHAHNTLVVSYVKPRKILEEEAAATKERLAMKAM